MAGFSSAATVARLSFSTIAGSVPAGRNSAYQLGISKSVSPCSRAVARSGRPIVKPFLVEPLALRESPDIPDYEMIPVGRCFGHASRPGEAAGACDVLDNDGLTKILADSVSHDPRDHVARTTGFATAVGCTQSTPAAVLACLRALPVSTIRAHQAATFSGLGPAPTVDGKVLTQSIGPALASGQFNRVPVMNGTNHSEWNLFVGQDFDLTGHPLLNTEAGYEAAIATLTGPVAAPIVAAQYPLASFPSADLAFGAVGTDLVFACPALTADKLSTPFVPTFAYEFNDPNAPQNFLPPVSFTYGASHASEIQYLFPQASPSAFGLKLPQTPLNASQQQLSDSMVLYWTRFAKHGDPNGSGNSNWPVFAGNTQTMISLVPATPTTETNFAIAHHCAFWSALLGATN